MSRIIDFIKSLLLAIFASIIIVFLVFETVTVEGTSMTPTLKDKDKLIIDKVSYHFKEPKFGDIIVFKYPADIRDKYIKRIVAVAGDRVKLENNIVYVNGIEIYEPYINAGDEESIAGSFNEVTVPNNTVFVLGDNRDNSRDSRFPDVGFVNKKLIVGKAEFKIYPFNNIGRIR